MTTLIAEQDGGQFYNAETGELIVDYGNLVQNDYDMIGSQRARNFFRMNFPDYHLPLAENETEKGGIYVP